jgi:hypothetical protein
MGTTFLWLPVAAVFAHLLEEFVWPGGFAEWYRQYPPGHTTHVSTRFLVIVNVAFVGLALLPPQLGPYPRGYAIWITVAAIAAANAVFHIVAVIRTHKYSPGVVTGVVLYLPLLFVGGAYLMRRELVSTGTLIEAIVVGIAYHVWSAWNHRRHASLSPAAVSH